MSSTTFSNLLLSVLVHRNASVNHYPKFYRVPWNSFDIGNVPDQLFGAKYVSPVSKSCSETKTKCQFGLN